MTLEHPLPHPITRVAVIGAGPGGLAAANALRREGTFDTIVIYERRGKVGGIWNYSPDTDASPPMPSEDCFDVNAADTQLLHRRSAVYDNLHTNLPRDVMSFRDEAFSAGTPMFPSHEQVLDYLVQYARSKELEPHIRLNTNIIRVEPVANTWQITSMTTEDIPRKRVETFDAVVVATGQDAVPFVPMIEGFTHAKGVTWLHSRDYRRPDPFAGKTVLVIGGGFSSTDIVREVATVAKKVYHSVRTDNMLTKHARRFEKSDVQHVGGLRRYNATSKEWECEDGGTFGPVDAVVFATGYMYSFPFFPMEMQKDLLKDGRKVNQLYQFEFYKRNPTLAFVGLPIHVVPFVVAQAQAVVAARVWNGRIKLPPLEPDVPEKSSNNRHDFVMEPEQEFIFIDNLNAWAEGFHGNMKDWKSTDPLTGPLSEEYKANRRVILELRAQHLGY